MPDGFAAKPGSFMLPRANRGGPARPRPATPPRGLRMRRQFLYIAGRLAGPFAAAALCLTAVVWLTQSLRFMELIVDRALPPATFLAFTALMTPSVLPVVLPVALFVAVLAVYSRLAADSELVVLRATGFSNPRLAAPAAAFGAVAAVAVLAIDLYVAPAGLREFKDRQHALRHSLAGALLREGAFNRPVDGVTIFVRERGADGGLRGVALHDDRDPRRPYTVIAERGALLAGPSGPLFALEDGSRQEFDADGGRASFLYFDRYAFDFAAESSVRRRTREASERFLGELLAPGERTDERRRREYRAEAYRRLIDPLHSAVLALIAAWAVLGGEFDRRRQWRRVLVGAGAGAAFLAAALVLRSAMVGEPRLAVLYGLAVLACAAAAARALFSEPRRRGAAAGAG